MRNKTPEKWLVNTVAKGIGLLMGARLQGAPFAGNPKDVQAVCESWLIAFMAKKIDWHQDSDQWRLESAFKFLVANARKWPAVAELFDYLPPRKETSFSKLAYRPDIERNTRIDGFRHLSEIRKQLGLPQKPISHPKG